MNTRPGKEGIKHPSRRETTKRVRIMVTQGITDTESIELGLGGGRDDPKQGVPPAREGGDTPKSNSNSCRTSNPNQKHEFTTRSYSCSNVRQCSLR